jgi:hypothetical protein
VAGGIAVGLFLYFSAVVLWSAESTPLLLDPALHASIAKNLAQGYGWAMSYHRRDPFLETTTGPAIMLSGAAMVVAFGNALWVPSVTVAGWNLGLLGTFLWRLQSLVEQGAMLLSIVAGLLAAYLFFDSVWWTTFVGEIPSFLLFLVACTVAADERLTSERRRFLLLGVLAGLCIHVRMLGLPGFAGLAGYLLLRARAGVRRGTTTWGALVRHGLSGAAGVAVLVVPVRLVEALVYYHSGGYGYAEFLERSRDWYWSNNAVGLGPLMDAPHPLAYLWGNVVLNARLFSGALAMHGIDLPAQLLVGIGTILLAVGVARRDTTGYGGVVAALGCGLAGYALWFFPLAHSLNDRYALHPLLASVTLVVLVAAWWLPRAGVPSLLLAVAVTAPPTRLAVATDLLQFREPNWVHRLRSPQSAEAEAYLRQWMEQGWEGRPAAPGETDLPGYNALAEEAAAFLTAHQFRHPLANCGWLTTTRELEYLLPGVEHFKDCYRSIEEALRPIGPVSPGAPTPGRTNAAGEASGAPAYAWTHPVNFTLVMHKLHWEMAKSYRQDRLRQDVLEAACDPTPLFESPLYRIVECEFEALRRLVPLDARTPFVGSPPIWNHHAKRRLGLS